MDKIKEILWITDKYLGVYRKKFDKISKNSSTDIALKYVKILYEKENKYWDLVPLHRYYPDYYFLNDLWRFERDKYVFLYSLERYIKYLEFFENIWLNEEYLYYLNIDIDIDDDYFNDEELILFPQIHYRFWEKKNWKLWKFDWDFICKFNDYLDEYKNYFDKIINETWLNNYLDITYFSLNYWCWIEYWIKIDFNFDVWKYKRRLIEFI